MNKIKSLLVFLVLLALVFLISYLITGNVFPSSDTKFLWFYSGIVMVLYSMFLIEPYYTAPTNVTSNCTSIILVLLSIKNEVTSEVLLDYLWGIAFSYTITILVISLVSIILKDNSRSEDYIPNKLSEICKTISVSFGSGKIIYSGMFLVFILFYYNIKNIYVLALMILWWVIVVTEPQKVVEKISRTAKHNSNEIGEIIGVQSKKIFLAKLFIDRPAIKKFDMVEFCYSMDERSRVFKGIVFDSYFLNQEKWIKVLHVGESLQQTNAKKNIVYKILPDENEAMNEILSRFVGVVIEHSDIGNIKFEYSTRDKDIEEGDLVEISVHGKTIFYQVINAIIDVEHLEAKNITGFIRGEAIQLGLWNTEKSCFEKYGWLPDVNSLVLKAKTDFILPQVEYPDYCLGVIPSTQLPSVINLHQAVSHHIAILGVTGAGKSYISREILKSILTDTKVICVDFTGEYIEKLASLKPKSIINDVKGLKAIEEEIANKEQATRSKNSAEILKFKESINLKLTEYVERFLKSDDNLSIFELPDLSNSTFILEFTQMFLDSVFKYAKCNQGQKICIVIEEAHTVIPETSSLGELGDFGNNKALVNKIGQIALQGRKYGVGFMIIAQRTANVSKTVLTQCNSVICFQAFDKTSYDFLENYLGSNLVKVLPNLKPYHAIVVGKAFKANIPMIVDLTRENETDTIQTTFGEALGQVAITVTEEKTLQSGDTEI